MNILQLNKKVDDSLENVYKHITIHGREIDSLENELEMSIKEVKTLVWIGIIAIGLATLGLCFVLL